MPSDSFDPEEDKDERSPAGFGSGGQVSYKSTGGSTPTAGSPGFVNLGQLLSLNRESGRESAQTLNKGVAAQADRAEKGVGEAEKKFRSEVDTNIKETVGGIKFKDGKPVKTPEYSGPSGWGDVKSIDSGGLRTGIASAQERLKTIESPESRAALAGKVGLSPTQSAASSFYMGTSNPIFEQTRERFKGLGDLMANAQKRSLEYAGGAKGRIGEGVKIAQQNEANRLKAEEIAKKKAMAEEIKRRDAEADALRAKERAENTRNRRGGSGMVTTDERTIAARMGLPYEEWVALGGPTDWNDPRMDKYTENRRTGGL